MSSSVPKALGRSKGDTLKNMGGMEVALVSDILRTVGMKIAPQVIKEFSSIAGVTKDLQELQDLVEGINLWLQTVGDKAMRNGQSSNWLKKLKDAAYDTEDLVHEFHIEAVKHDENVVGVKNVVVKYLWTKPKSAVFRCKTAHKIMEIKNRFDAIVKERYDYSTTANSMSVDRLVLHISNTIGEVPLWTNVDETSIFGRDQVKNQIIAELIETNDQQKIKIVSVIGLGGSGKTTLAKLVFNDGDIIKKHFEEILWVHVSREFVVEKLVEKLFEAIAGDKPNHLPLQRVSRTISDKLAVKRFLLVLDDVWTEDHIHWEQFMVHLKSGAPGSSILLTTRSRKIADAVDSTYTCDLPFLSEEDSWKVFHQNFGIAIEGLDPEFLQMGKQIVRKCGGVALAIKVLAGSLRGMKEIEEWQSIRDSNLLDVEDEEHRVSSCLWLSYFHLPHHLKDCFTHCSIFPRGYVIKRRHLISQWIACGFVNVTNQVQQPEDVGIGYFDSLLKVGFLQDQEVGHCEPISYDETRYKMHDLVHDLARKIKHDEFVSEVETVDQINRRRYVSLTSCTGEVDDKLFDKVRALYISRGNLVFGKITKKHSPVRTIILKHISVALLHTFVSKLEHLGYLEISYINCEALPEAITQCSNLEAIHVLGCTRLTTLPKSIGKLKKLRALELNGSQNVKSLPQSIGGCDNLQRLILYNCGFKDIPNSIEKLEKLRVLTVAHSYDLRRLSSPEFFGKLRNLQAIDLSGCWGLEHLPQCFILLCHLEYVNLAHCGLVELPEGLGNLKKLQVFNLQGCHALCGLPAGCGQLTRLQKLGLFVVGGNAEHARISELENLDKLNGKMQIKNIEYVRDPDDAEKARLKKKDGIQKLSLDWYLKGATWASDMEEQLVVSSMVKNKDLHLLNSLEPPSEIEELRISGYRGSQLPRWMTKQTGSCDLADIHMQNSPPQFSRLTELVLENLPNLEHLQGIMDLPGIKILELRVMPKLAELLTTRTGLANWEEELEMQCCFPRLSTLLIRDCPKLNVKPYFPPSLQKLTLEGTNNEQLLSSACYSHPRHAVHAHGNVATSSSCIMYVKPPHLTQLNISGLIGPSSGWKVLSHLSGLCGLEICNCEDLRQLPESMRSLTCLHRLSISICMDLYVLPEWLGEFQSVQDLYIASLPRISNLPQSIERLTSLQRLAIHDCREVHQLPEQLGELCSLRDLRISHVPALTYLPKSFQRLTSLQEFHLSDCYMLTQLPESLGELSALRKFWIECCPGLKSLPSSIQHLTALEELVISDCPELVRRCKEGVGKDWPLVSHIPDLRLHG